MRKRILLVIGATLGVMLGMIWVATRAILVSSFQRIELAAMRDNVDRVRAALERDQSTLASTVSDWAPWDETYSFVRTLDPAYVASNLPDATIANLGLDAMVFVDTDGRILHAKLLHGAKPDLAAALARYPSLLRPPADLSATSGLAALGDETWLLAAHPILPSDGKPPSRGTLVIGRRLDHDEVARLSSRVLLDVRITSRAALAPGDPALAALAKIPDGTSVWVARPAADRLMAYAALRDLAGEPSSVVVVGTHSEIGMLAMRSVLGAMVWIILTGVLFGTAALVYLERQVLARVHSLSAQLLAIKTGDRPWQRLEIPGTDEIAYLAAATNGMLATVEASTQALRASERRTQAFLDVVPDVIVLVAPDATVRDIRLPVGWSIPGLTEQLRGRPLKSLDAAFAFVRHEDRGRLLAAAEAARGTQTPQMVEIDFDDGGERRSLEVRVSATAAGETVYAGRDVTAHRRAEEAERQEILLKEIHHRVRNNLQLISSLLGLQSAATDDARARGILAESQDRIRSMALIHERLTHATPAGEIGFAAYIQDLVEHLGRSYAGTTQAVEIRADLDDVSLPADASLPAGLITSELLTNALRHAFPGGRAGRIVVTLRQGADRTVELTVADDGIGLPPGTSPETAPSLGYMIVGALLKQLHGHMEVAPRGDAGEGTTIRVILPAG